MKNPKQNLKWILPVLFLLVIAGCGKKEPIRLIHTDSYCMVFSGYGTENVDVNCREFGPDAYCYVETAWGNDDNTATIDAGHCVKPIFK